MMPDLEITDSLTLPGAELRESFARSGGPGGQHVNKTESKAELRWNPADSGALTDAQREALLARLGNRLTTTGDLVVTSERTRDQSRNRDDARRKLAAIIRAALIPPKPRKPTRPTNASRRRRLSTKKHRGTLKRTRRPPDED